MKKEKSQSKQSNIKLNKNKMYDHYIHYTRSHPIDIYPIATFSGDRWVEAPEN